MNGQILNTILENTYTASQLKHRLSILKANLLKKIFNAEQTEQALNETDSNWLKSLSPDFLKTFNKDNIYQIFEDIEKEIAKLTPLTLYLTFDPDEVSLNEIGQHARKTFKNLMLLDIKYDPGLIAGAALSFKGVYRDYSLKSRIEERKMLILENFKKFLR